MKKIIDLDVKKTEREWTEATDDFYLKYVPKWFDFLNWIILLGIFHFLAESTEDLKVDLLG